MNTLASNTSFNYKNIQVNKDEFVDLISLLTYCKINHPSKDLRKAANYLLEKFYNEGLFNFPIDK